MRRAANVVARAVAYLGLTLTFIAALTMCAVYAVGMFKPEFDAGLTRMGLAMVPTMFGFVILSGAGFLIAEETSD